MAIIALYYLNIVNCYLAAVRDFQQLENLFPSCCPKEWSKRSLVVFQQDVV